MFGLLCGASPAVAGAVAPGAAEAAAVHGYALAGGDLSAVLNALAAESGVQLLYDPKLLAGRRSGGLHGRYEVAQALAHVLRGSGLEAVAVNPATFVVRPAPRPGAAAAPRATVEAEPVPAPPTELSSVIVDDRSLPRTAGQPMMPVTEITREQIDSSGYTTLFDLLRAQPGVQVANQPEAMAAASDANFRTGAAGAAAVALRRLGAKSTLVLVDGRRIAGYGLSQDGTGTVPDLNAIPLAMVERVEILRDGASAVYGSDAVAGVINIILRHDFSGAEASAYAGESARGDAAAQQASVLWGGRSAGGVGLLLNLDEEHGDPLPGSARSWYSLDQRRQGLEDLRSLYSFPGNYVYADPGGLRYAAVPGCASADLSAGACLLDGAKYTTLQTGKDGRSLLGRVDAPLGESARLYADVRATRLTQRQQAAPSAALLVLATDPDAPEPQPVERLYSFNDIGPVRETTESTLTSLDLGASGTLAGWTWGVDASVQRNRVVDAIDGLIRATLPTVDGEQYGFGASPPSAALREAMAPRVVRKGVAALDDLALDASGPVFGLPGGPATLAAGVEVRRDGLRQRPDPALLRGELLNQPPEYAQDLRRGASAAYLRLELPLAERFDAQIAARVEKTGGFAANAAPTLGLRWNPFESLVLRGSLSQGWRAPTLLELHQPGGIAGQGLVWVPASAGPCQVEVAAVDTGSACLVDVTQGGNPALQPERSRTMAIGAVWAPAEAVSFSADWYRSVRRHEIAALPPAFAFAHPELFPGFLQRDADGQLAGLDEFLVNVARTTTRGVDGEVRWDLDARSFGRLRLSLGLNYLQALDRETAPGEPAQRSAGFADTPRLTGVSTLRWTLGDWIGGANLRYVGSYSLDPYRGAGQCPDYKAVQGKCAIPPFVLLNLNLTYAGLPRWKFTVSVNNALDHAPRYYDEAAGGYDAAFDDPLGRYYALRASYRF